MGEVRAQFGLLGPMELTIDGVVRPTGGPKQRAVLAYLVVNANHPVSVDALAQAVWEDAHPPDVRVSLHTIVSNLRKPLREAGLDARAILAQVGAGYRITVPEGGCDVQRFHAQRQTGLQALAEGRFPLASKILAEALSQWRGPVLADLRGLGFADAYAAVLDDDRLGVIEARADADIARGRAEAAISELSLLVSAHPLREPLWERLITALYADGRQTDALDALRRLRTTLADELGIDPSPHIRALEAQILRQDPLGAPGAVSARHATTVIEHSAWGRAAVLYDRAGHTYPVTGPYTTIGRLPDNDVVLAHVKVSRHHAVILDTGHAHVVKDLQSSNGVFLDGVRVDERAELPDGAVLRIGGIELTFTQISQGTRTS